MSMKFKATVRKNPVDKSLKYYPAPATPEVVELEQIVKEIEKTSTVSEADIVGVIASFQREVIENLKHGRSVRLGDLGSFRISITGKGSESEEDVTASSIQRIRPMWSRSGRMSRALRVGAEGITFEKVSSPAGTGAGD